MGKKLYCSETAYNPYREINEREITESIFVIDGYSIADRLLEGVRFNVHFGDDKILSVNVDPDDAGFFSQFNEKMFLKQVEVIFGFQFYLLEEQLLLQISQMLKEK